MWRPMRLDAALVVKTQEGKRLALSRGGRHGRRCCFGLVIGPTPPNSLATTSSGSPQPRVILCISSCDNALPGEKTSMVPLDVSIFGAWVGSQWINPLPLSLCVLPFLLVSMSK